MENVFLSHLEGMLQFNDELGTSIKTYGNSNYNESHAKKMLERMFKCYEEGKFCDVTLVVGEIEIRTQRLLLSSLSSFFSKLFDSNWNDSNQDNIEINEFDEKTLTCILHFAYTGELQLNPCNVLGVLAAADFLQLVELDFIKESVGDYLKEKVTKENCPGMLVIAEQFHAVKLKSFLVTYAARNFVQISQSEVFLDLSIELLLEIMQSEVLVVDHGRDFLPPPTEQENFIVDIVLKYVSHQSENEQQSDLLLSKLIYYIRFHFLSPLSLEKLCCYARDACCSETLMLIMQAREELEAGDTNFWGMEHERGLPKERCYKIHADRIHVGPVEGIFGGESFTREPILFIQGMKIWIRSWDDHLVIGGLEVFYSTGESVIESPMYGDGDEDSVHRVHEFHLGDSERIVEAEVRSSWMVDSLTFFTNQGQKLGPYGGDGGSKYTEKPRGEYGFLSYLKGAVVKTQEKLGITKLQLIWKEYFMLDQCDSDRVDVEHNSTSSSISSESSQYESD